MAREVIFDLMGGVDDRLLGRIERAGASLIKGIPAHHDMIEDEPFGPPDGAMSGVSWRPVTGRHVFVKAPLDRVEGFIAQLDPGDQLSWTASLLSSIGTVSWIEGHMTVRLSLEDDGVDLTLGASVRTPQFGTFVDRWLHYCGRPETRAAVLGQDAQLSDEGPDRLPAVAWGTFVPATLAARIAPLAIGEARDRLGAVAWLPNGGLWVQASRVPSEVTVPQVQDLVDLLYDVGPQSRYSLWAGIMTVVLVSTNRKRAVQSPGHILEWVDIPGPRVEE